MSWKNVKLIFLREVRDQLRDRRTLFMITILPVMLYPMLGLGVVEMMLTFSEQRRSVVILNADELPASPSFLNEEGVIDNHWLSGGAEDAASLLVVTDAQTTEDESDDTKPRRRNQLSRAELLSHGAAIGDRFAELEKLRGSGSAAPELNVVQDQLSGYFSESGLQVLVIVPDGYAEAIASLETHAVNGIEAGIELPSLKVLRNSADDKSVVAFGRVQDALINWESTLRTKMFQQASLRPELQHPAGLQWVELARGEEVAANVWSKLFPAMIVIMALTGAFYPAIDLGAGEKERGTMETLLISPARRVELVFGKFLTILMFSIGTAVMNLVSMGFTGQHMASAMGAGLVETVNLELPGFTSIMWLLVLLVPLAALFSALCLALATFAKSTKEGQYYLTPLLMVILGLTMFCLSPSIEITPLYSVIPVVNVALLLKGLLLSTNQSGDLLGYIVPVLISSVGYSALALWWAIDLYNSEGVLFREAEKFDLKLWFVNLTKDKEPVPAMPEAIFCFVMILLLQFVAMNYMKPDLSGDPAVAGPRMMQTIVVQQLTMIACPAVFMGLLLTTSLRATFRLRMPSIGGMLTAVVLAILVHPLSVEISSFMVERGILPPPPMEGIAKMSELLQSPDISPWLVITVFALTPAICEELAFRGFIMSGLAKGGRLGIAVIASSLMFGIIHMIPQQAFNASLVGLIVGLIAVHTRSLFPAIAFHFCNNTIATMHGRNGFGIDPDGVFFSRVEGGLRYELPLLIPCAIGIGIFVARMLRDLRQEQEEKRLAALESFDAPTTNENPADQMAAGI